MLTKRHSLLLLIAATAFGGMSAWAGPAGTTLEITKTAETTWTQVNTYFWEISKTPQFPDQVTYVILPSETAQVGFTVKADRSGPMVETRNTTVAGEICIENTGLRATQNLMVMDQLEVFEGGQWVSAYPQFPILTSGEIAAGQKPCFNYSIDVTIDPNKEYRNRVTAAIDNYLGYEGTSHEVQQIADVTVNIDIQNVNPSVTVRDTFQCAVGFQCTPNWSDQLISDSQTFTYTVAVTNIGALCGETVTLTNTASIDYGTRNDELNSVGPSASATATVYSGSCRTP